MQWYFQAWLWSWGGNIPGEKQEKSFLRIYCLSAERWGVGLIGGGLNAQQSGKKALPWPSEDLSGVFWTLPPAAAFPAKHL